MHRFLFGVSSCFLLISGNVHEGPTLKPMLHIAGWQTQDHSEIPGKKSVFTDAVLTSLSFTRNPTPCPNSKAFGKP